MLGSGVSACPVLPLLGLPVYKSPGTFHLRFPLLHFQPYSFASRTTELDPRETTAARHDPSGAFVGSQRKPGRGALPDGEGQSIRVFGSVPTREEPSDKVTFKVPVQLRSALFLLALVYRSKAKLRHLDGHRHNLL